MASQQLYSYLGRAGLWKNVSSKLAENGTQLAPCDARALKDLCAGVTWMQRVPPAVLASYRALYVILRGDAAAAEDEISRDIMRTVRGTTGLLLDLSSGDARSDFAGSINRVLNALAHVDDMGYCQGQNYVVDVMMKAGLPERETFCLFLYLLRQGHFHGMYRKEVAMLAGYMDKLEEQLRDRLPKLAAHFESEHYPPPLYALEWITTFFGLAAQPLVSLVALDLFLAGARNPVLRLCVSLLGEMKGDLLGLDQEGLLKSFRSRAVNVDAERVIVRALSEKAAVAAAPAETRRSSRDGGGRSSSDRALGWSTGPDYLLVLRCRHSQTAGLAELREEAKSGLIAEKSSLQDALLAVTRSLGWETLRTCWLDTCLAARSDHERYNLAGDSLRFVIANGGHVKAASFMLGVGGADANGVDSRLLSPLHLVAMFNRPDIARVLLMCGASPRLVGGVSRAAAVRGGRLWSPLEMAEEACTEGGALDDGIAMGPAALFVLRGLVCLQCNVKLPKPGPCGTCKLTFCSSCQKDHFCIGRLNLPRGVAEAVGDGGGVGGANAGASGARGSSGGGGRGDGASAWRGEEGEAGAGINTRWELGSAIGDDWEALFSESNVNARGGAALGSDGGGTDDREGWRPGRLRRLESGTPKNTDEDSDFSVSSSLSSSLRPWATMPSVLLGTWERRPQTSSQRDRDRLLDNSAAFVRACFPAQTWLQYNMEEEMGLSLGLSQSRHGWGGSLKGLGMRGEYFKPEIMQASGSTELHRHMSWVMSESGVPWEANDDTWCCPECFILFSLNVFRHHCRGCGQVYCSAHAPPTAVPPEDRSLKLCWSCVLEGAVPLPASLLEDDGDDEDTLGAVDSLSSDTARSIAEIGSMPRTGATPAGLAGAYDAAPTAAAGESRADSQLPSPRRGSVQEGGRHSDEGRKRHNVKEEGGGFLSALVSLIEVVASPTSPSRSRDCAAGERAQAGQVSSTACRPHPQSSAGPQAGNGQGERRGAGGRGGGGDWRAGWSTLPASEEGLAVEAHPAAVEQRGAESPLRLRKEYGSGSEIRTEVASLSPQKERGFASLSTAGSLTESGEDYDSALLRNSGGGGGGGRSSSGNDGRAGLSSVAANRGDVGIGVLLDEKPVELGFPSERPWAHGFG
ncbi:unnamed protein product [Scytosiphon promiscuus]